MKNHFRLAIVLCILTIVAVFPMTVLATYGQSASACGSAANYGNTRICVYENANGSGDRLTTNATLSNLHNVNHTLAGDCNAVLPQSTWADCISSVRAYIPSGSAMRICLYVNLNLSHC